jgi:hypothetical protein
MMRLQLARTALADRTLPAQRLVEFRCRSAKGPHLLAVIYQSSLGPLAISTADVLFDAEEIPQHNARNREFMDRQREFAAARRSHVRDSRHNRVTSQQLWPA